MEKVVLLLPPLSPKKLPDTFRDTLMNKTGVVLASGILASPPGAHCFSAGFRPGLDLAQPPRS